MVHVMDTPIWSTVIFTESTVNVISSHHGN